MKTIFAVSLLFAVGFFYQSFFPDQAAQNLNKKQLGSSLTENEAGQGIKEALDTGRYQCCTQSQ